MGSKADDCDTSLRSSGVGASLNPEALHSAAGLPPGSALYPKEGQQLQAASPNCVCVCARFRERERGAGFALTHGTLNLRECNEQEPLTTTRIHIRLI